MGFKKFLPLIFILIGCSKDKTVYWKSIEFDTSRKKLSHFFIGDKFYRIKGIKSEDGKFKLIKKKNLFQIQSIGKNFLGKYQSGTLTENKLDLLLHDFGSVPSLKVKLILNKFQNKDVFFTPDLTKDQLEVLGNRTGRIYRFIDHENCIDTDDNLIDIKTLNFNIESQTNLLKLNKNKLDVSNYRNIYAIENPLSGKFTILPELAALKTSESPLSKFAVLLENIKSFDNKSKKTNLKALTIEGKFEINEDYIIDGRDAVIKKGTTLILSDGASLKFFNCRNIEFQGTKENPIVISGLDKNSIMFYNCSNVINRYVIYNGLSNYEDKQLILPSAITFYKSSTTINNCTFHDNKIGDDYLNIYKSKFHITDCSFNRILSDAVDVDFSNGLISACEFIKVGNDAIDCSGSNVKIFKNKMHLIGDKAISAGENSNISANSNSIKNASLAVVVKDGSSVQTNNNALIDNELNYAVFQKKKFYPKPILKANVTNFESNYLFSSNSVITIIYQNKKIESLKYSNNIRDLLYGNVYGKASK